MERFQGAAGSNNILCCKQGFPEQHLEKGTLLGPGSILCLFATETWPLLTSESRGRLLQGAGQEEKSPRNSSRRSIPTRRALLWGSRAGADEGGVEAGSRPGAAAAAVEAAASPFVLLPCAELGAMAGPGAGSPFGAPATP